MKKKNPKIPGIFFSQCTTHAFVFKFNLKQTNKHIKKQTNTTFCIVIVNKQKQTSHYGTQNAEENTLMIKKTEQASKQTNTLGFMFFAARN